LKTYGWKEHDGVNFGVQEIVDHNIKIVTSFVKKSGGAHGGDWTSRIQIQPLVSSLLINNFVNWFPMCKEAVLGN